LVSNIVLARSMRKRSQK